MDYITYDTRFATENSPIVYYPLGLLISEDFKCNPSRRSVWFEAVNVNRTHLVKINENECQFTGLTDQVDNFLDKKVPSYMADIIYSRSRRYDESDRVKSICTGFIFINIGAKEINGDLTYDGNYLLHKTPRGDQEVLKRNQEISKLAGKKWSNLQENINKCLNYLNKDILEEIIPYFATNMSKYKEEIKPFVNDNSASWKCICTYYNKETKRMEQEFLPLFYDSTCTIGFRIPIEKKYKTAQVIFEGTELYFKSDIIQVQNFNIYGYLNDKMEYF